MLKMIRQIFNNKITYLVFFLLLMTWMVDFPSQNIYDAYCLPNFNINQFHLLGCSPLGEDMGELLFWGTFQTIAIAVLARIFAIVFSFFGFIIAYQFKLAAVFSRITEAFITIPSLLIALSLGFLFGSGSISMILAIGISEWSFNQKWLLGRMKEYERFSFIASAKMFGGSRKHILFFHFIPFLKEDLIFLFYIYLPGSILTVASLEFLGLSAIDNITGIGYMIAAYKDMILIYPHIILPPIFIIITVVFLSLTFRKKRKSNE